MPGMAAISELRREKVRPPCRCWDLRSGDRSRELCPGLPGLSGVVVEEDSVDPRPTEGVEPFVCCDRLSFAGLGSASRTLSRFRMSQRAIARSEEHTSELQSHLNLVCRLLLEKKKTRQQRRPPTAYPPTTDTCD